MSFYEFKYWRRFFEMLISPLIALKYHSEKAQSVQNIGKEKYQTI